MSTPSSSVWRHCPLCTSWCSFLMFQCIFLSHSCRPQTHPQASNSWSTLKQFLTNRLSLLSCSRYFFPTFEDDNLLYALDDVTTGDDDHSADDGAQTTGEQEGTSSYCVIPEDLPAVSESLLRDSAILGEMTSPGSTGGGACWGRECFVMEYEVYGAIQRHADLPFLHRVSINCIKILTPQVWSGFYKLGVYFRCGDCSV